MSTIHERAVKSVSNLIKDKHNFEILHTNYKCLEGIIDIIAQDPSDDTIHFVQVREFPEKLPKVEDKPSMQRRAINEALAIQYLINEDLPNATIVFDEADMVIVGDSQAFVRYHVDAYNLD